MSIEGKVAKILGPRTLVINRGSEDGVRVGMFFDVLNPNSDQIEDPETHEILGEIHRPKARLKVTKVQKKLAELSTYRTYQVNVGGEGGLSSFSGIQKMLEPPRWVTRTEKIETDERTLASEQVDNNIRTGDPVIQVDSDES